MRRPRSDLSLNILLKFLASDLKIVYDSALLPRPLCVNSRVGTDHHDRSYIPQSPDTHTMQGYQNLTITNSQTYFSGSRSMAMDIGFQIQHPAYWIFLLNFMYLEQHHRSQFRTFSWRSWSSVNSMHFCLLHPDTRIGTNGYHWCATSTLSDAPYCISL